MNRFKHGTDFCVSLLAIFFAGCTSSESTTATDTTAAASSALQSAQCDFQSFKASVDACFAAFESCKSGADAGATVDEAACKATLESCLPPAPSGKGHGGKKGPHDPNDTDDIGEDHAPPPPGDGGLPPKRGDGDNDRGGHPKGGSSGSKGDHPAPDAAAIQACHDTLSACLAADGADKNTCMDAEDKCVREAFRSPFKAKCDEATPACADDSTSEACSNVKRCCKDGVDGPPKNDDGGAQCAAAAQ